MKNLAFPQIIVWIVTALSLPFAVLVGAWVGEGRTREVSLFGGTALLFFFLFAIPHWLWPFAAGSIFLQGNMLFLPVTFKPLDLLLLLLIARFAVDDVILRRQSIKLGPRPDYFFILTLFALLLLHGVQDRFGMRQFGSDIWGGRSYFTLIVCFCVYFVLQSTRLDLRAFRSLPTIAVACGAIDFFSNAFTFVMPEFASIIGFFYSSVYAGGEGDFMRRLGFAGNFGYLLLYWSLSDCRMQDFLHKARFFKASVFILGVFLCLISGYRSTLFVAAIIISIAAFRDLRGSSIFILIPVSLVVAGLISLHLAGVQLPAVMQRGLTMVPGIEWERGAMDDSRNSNEFRTQVWDIWIKQQFPQHPILGRGFGLNSDDMMATVPYTTDEIGGFGATLLSLRKYSRDEAFVVGGHLHHGFYSTVDRFGILGALCFILWTFVALRRMFKELLSSRTRPMNPALQWLALYVIVNIIAFPIGALRVEVFLPHHLVLCGLFAALYSATYKKELAETPKPSQASPSTPLATANVPVATS